MYFYIASADKKPERLPIESKNKNYCFDDVEVIVLPENGLIDTAEAFKALVCLAAISRSLDPVIIISDSMDDNHTLLGNIDTLNIDNGYGVIERKYRNKGSKIIYGKYLLPNNTRKSDLGFSIEFSVR